MGNESLKPKPGISTEIRFEAPVGLKFRWVKGLYSRIGTSADGVPVSLVDKTYTLLVTCPGAWRVCTVSTGRGGNPQGMLGRGSESYKTLNAVCTPHRTNLSTCVTGGMLNFDVS